MTRIIGKVSAGPVSALRKLAHGAALGVGLLTLGGCATSMAPVEVTRFHEAEPARSGTLVLMPEEPDDAGSLEYRTFANGVANALARTGFTILDDGARGDYVAVIGVARHVQLPVDRRKSPVSVGVGGATGGYGGGVGVGIGIDLSGKPKSVIATQLRVQIRRAADKVAIWEGRAEMAVKENAPAAQPGIAAGKLAEALFKDYPGRSGETITVK